MVLDRVRPLSVATARATARLEEPQQQEETGFLRDLGSLLTLQPLRAQNPLPTARLQEPRQQRETRSLRQLNAFPQDGSLSVA
jgi:hypothetical protein